MTKVFFVLCCAMQFDVSRGRLLSVLKWGKRHLCHFHADQKLLSLSSTTGRNEGSICLWHLHTKPAVPIKITRAVCFWDKLNRTQFLGPKKIILCQAPDVWLRRRQLCSFSPQDVTFLGSFDGQLLNIEINSIYKNYINIQESI